MGRRKIVDNAFRTAAQLFIIFCKSELDFFFFHKLDIQRFEAKL